jgi:hypothetical protein
MYHHYFEGIDIPLTPDESTALAKHEARTAAAYDSADVCIVSETEAVAIQQAEDVIFRKYRLRRERCSDLAAFKQARHLEFFGPADPIHDLQSGKKRTNLAAKKLQYDSQKKDYDIPTGRRAYAEVFLAEQAKDEITALEPRRLNYGYNGDEKKCEFHKTTIKQLFIELRAYVQADLASLDAEFIEPKANATTRIVTDEATDKPGPYPILGDSLSESQVHEVAKKAGFINAKLDARRGTSAATLWGMVEMLEATTRITGSKRNEFAVWLGKTYGVKIRRSYTPNGYPVERTNAWLKCGKALIALQLIDEVAYKQARTELNRKKEDKASKKAG